MRTGLLALAVLLGLVVVAPAADEPPFKRLLQGEDAKKVAELEKRADDLEAEGKFADAAKAAEEALAVRRRVQGETHWQTAATRRQVETLRRLAEGPREKRTAAAEAARSEKQATAHVEKGEYVQAEVLFRKAIEMRRTAVGDAHRHCSRPRLARRQPRRPGKYADAEKLFATL
jgi:tetratricopeptide (TPR) repeat protein